MKVDHAERGMNSELQNFTFSAQHRSLDFKLSSSSKTKTQKKFNRTFDVSVVPFNFYMKKKISSNLSEDHPESHFLIKYRKNVTIISYYLIKMSLVHNRFYTKTSKVNSLGKTLTLDNTKVKKFLNQLCEFVSSIFN